MWGGTLAHRLWKHHTTPKHMIACESIQSQTLACDGISQSQDSGAAQGLLVPPSPTHLVGRKPLPAPCASGPALGRLTLPQLTEPTTHGPLLCWRRAPQRLLI